MADFMFQLKPKQILRFWSWVKKVPSGCWEWQGCLTKTGYGRFQVHPKTLRAHKVSYFLCKGSFPNDFLVCHTCDNPRCVNPEHLWVGSPKDNVLDMIKKGRLVRHKSKQANVSSKYSGISLRKETGKWRARIMRNYSNILIGEYNSEEEAHLAREKYKKESQDCSTDFSHYVKSHCVGEI